MARVCVYCAAPAPVYKGYSRGGSSSVQLVTKPRERREEETFDQEAGELPGHPSKEKPLALARDKHSIN